MLTALEAIKKLPTDINFSEEKLSANIPAMEYRWGKKFLGNSFWSDLESQVSTKTEYKVLWQQVLCEYLAWALLYESRFNIQWSISTQGFMFNNTEYSQSDRNAYKNISEFIYDRVQIEQQKLDEFLTTYPSKFPLYGPNNESRCCNSKNQSIADYLGVNVELRNHSCGCDDDDDEPDFPDYIPEPALLQEFNINCQNRIQITGLYKNNLLIDSLLPKDFDDKDSVLSYLQGMDENWSLDGNYVKITTSDNWNINVCCI